MSVNGIGNNPLRFDGMATGLDTANIIRQLMKAESTSLDKLFRQKTVLQWKRDNYREITNALRAFRDEFMDVVRPLTNMRSASAYKQYSVNSSNASIVTATANSDALKGENVITQVSSLATAARVSSSTNVSASLKGSDASSLDFTSGDSMFNLTVDGVTRTIKLRDSYAYANHDDLVNNSTDGMQKLIDDAFGAGKVNVVADAGGIITFDSVSGTNKIVVTNAPANNALGLLNFANGNSNRISTGMTLEVLATKLAGGLTFDANDNVTFKVNNREFSFNKNQTLNQVMSGINSSGAGVEIRYSELTDKFTISAKRTGIGNTLEIVNTGGTLFGDNSALGVSAVANVTSVANGQVTAGTDAELTLNGVSLARSTNTFTIDGVTYTLNSIYNNPADAANPEIRISVNQNVDAIFDTIKNFVDKYNQLIGKINGKLTEKYDRKFLPLTDEQKKELSEGDLKAWEEKAKSGLLRNDASLQKIVNDMRRAIYDSVNGVTGGIAEIGIQTSADYRDRGMLVIDETKLRKAIESDLEKVQNLLSKVSDINYSPDLTAEQRKQRYNEQGIVNRLYDIIQDNIRTIRDSAGKKGILLEKAGIVGDITEFQNVIDKEIGQKETSITTIQEKLYRKEEYYYRMFAALERAISQMNTQSAWLYQQFNGGK